MGALTLLITGAGGFLGRRTVAAARARGHRVIAHTRRPAAALPEWNSDPGITPMAADLGADGADLCPLLQGADAIIHTAAALGGSEARQDRDTLQATRALLTTIGQSPARPRLVLVGSLAVYAGTSETLSETSPLEPRPDRRDAYCRIKLAQEKQAISAAQTRGFDLWVLRAGAILGPGRLWNAHIGLTLGPLLLRLATSGEVPLIGVGHCAALVVRAAETPPQHGPRGHVEIVNLLDDDRPDPARFTRAIAGSGWPRIVLPLHWRVFEVLGMLLACIPGLPRHLPGLLRPTVLRARLAPRRYDLHRLHQRLGRHPQPGFEAAMARAIHADKRGAGLSQMEC